MNLISRAEELVLLAILSLGDNAYGISILEFLQEKTGNAWSFAQIYDPLDRLSRKGYVGNGRAARRRNAAVGPKASTS